jgi:hypothetical protein
MLTTQQMPPSPLDSISNLQPVDPVKVRELEQRLTQTYLPKVVEHYREARERAEALRLKLLY